MDGGLLLLKLMVFIGILIYNATKNKTAEDAAELLESVKNNDFIAFNEIIKGGFDVTEDFTNDVGTILDVAIVNSNMKIIKKLLELGVNPNEVKRDGITSLSLAVIKNDIEIANELINYGADVNLSNMNSHPPLILAMENSNVEMVKLLIKSGADVNITDRKGNHAISYIFPNWDDNGLCLEFLNIFIDAGVNLDVSIYGGVSDFYTHEKDIYPCKKQLSLLSVAALRNNFEMVHRLLEANVDINGKNLNGDSALKVIEIFGYKMWQTCNLVEIEDNIGISIEKMNKLIKLGADISSITTKEIILAAYDNNIERVKELLSIGESINSRDSNDNNLLMIALLENNLDLVDLTLSMGADINNINYFDKTPLTLAIELNNFNLIKKIVEKGGNINHVTSNGVTLLMTAAEYGNYEIFKFFIDNYCDINAKDSNSRTILHYSLNRENIDLDIVMELLNSGANINSLDIDGNTPLLQSLIAGNSNLVLFHEFLNRGLDPNSRSDSNGSLLDNAIIRNQFEMVSELLGRGAKISDKTSFNNENNEEETTSYTYEMLKNAFLDRNSLCLAIAGLMINDNFYNERIKIIESLLNYGAIIDMEFRIDKNTISPLLLAIFTESSEAVKLLMEYGADIHKNSEVSYLVQASCGGFNGSFSNKEKKIELMRILLDAGINPNGEIVNGVQQMPIFDAIISNEVGFVNILLEYGANIETVEDTGGFTPLITAVYHGFTDIVTLLLEYGANVEASTNNGETSLMLAASSGNIEIAHLLLEYGANMDSKDVRGYTPYDTAVNSEEEAMIEFLKEYTLS